MASEVDPRTVAAVLAEGDRRRSLESLRDRLARELDDPELMPRDAAVISKELRSVIAELDSLPIAKEESKVDDLAARRARRRANAATSGSS